MENNDTPPPLRWPRYALAAVVLFLLLAVLWVSALVRRTRDQRYYPGYESSPTNLPAGH